MQLTPLQSRGNSLPPAHGHDHSEHPGEGVELNHLRRSARLLNCHHTIVYATDHRQQVDGFHTAHPVVHTVFHNLAMVRKAGGMVTESFPAVCLCKTRAVARLVGGGPVNAARNTQGAPLHQGGQLCPLCQLCGHHLLLRHSHVPPIYPQRRPK